MKKMLFLIPLLWLSGLSYGQESGGATRNIDTSLSKGDYLRKSKNQRTTGWVMLGGGVALVVAGVLVGSHTEEGEWFGDNLEEGAIMMAIGGAVSLGSIPFFISSGINARKAASLSFGFQKTAWPVARSPLMFRQPALSLRISL